MRVDILPDENRKFIQQSQVRMQEAQGKKYSKVSAALKCYFLRNMYYHRLSIKEAARRCKINYSTAKILLRDLTPKERTFIKLLIRQKEDQEDTHDSGQARECGHAAISPYPQRTGPKIEVVSRVAFDFFDLGSQ